LDWEDFLATRKALIEFEHTSVDSYEKAMLTLERLTKPGAWHRF
jgi:hypothetical protein